MDVRHNQRMVPVCRSGEKQISGLFGLQICAEKGTNGGKIEWDDQEQEKPAENTH
jgi:hypothetical protein